MPFFSLYLNICRLRKGPGKFFMGVLEKSWIFLSVREWEPCITTYGLTALGREMSTSLHYSGVRHTLPLPIQSGVCVGRERTMCWYFDRSWSRLRRWWTRWIRNTRSRRIISTASCLTFDTNSSCMYLSLTWPWPWHMSIPESFGPVRAPGL